MYMYIHDCPLSWFGTSTLIKSGRVKIGLWFFLVHFILVKTRISCQCFHLRIIKCKIYHKGNKFTYVIIQWNKFTYVIIQWNKFTYVIIQWNKFTYVIIQWSKFTYVIIQWYMSKPNIGKIGIQYELNLK